MKCARPEIRQISSDDLPERHRFEMWREVFGRQLCREDFEPLPGVPFRARYNVHTLPGLGILTGTNGGYRQCRTPELIGDGNADFIFSMVLKGSVVISQRGQELILDEQEAALLSSAEVKTFTRPSLGHVRSLGLPRAMIAPLLPRADDAVMRRVPRESPILQLLSGYLGLLEENHALADPQTAPLIVTQIHNLVAAAIGASRDTMELAKRRGVREARLASVRADILTNLSEVGLSPKAVAGRLGVSDRYVHLLFEETGQTFSRFVEEERLRRAFALLTDPTRAGVRIGEIALQVGFSEHATFDRAFRRHFGDTPRNVRRERLKVFVGA
jgi:AraC-like DNA-binding protein